MKIRKKSFTFRNFDKFLKFTDFSVNLEIFYRCLVSPPNSNSRSFTKPKRTPIFFITYHNATSLSLLSPNNIAPLITIHLGFYIATDKVTDIDSTSKIAGSNDRRARMCWFER